MTRPKGPSVERENALSFSRGDPQARIHDFVTAASTRSVSRLTFGFQNHLHELRLICVRGNPSCFSFSASTANSRARLLIPSSATLPVSGVSTSTCFYCAARLSDVMPVTVLSSCGTSFYVHVTYTGGKVEEDVASIIQKSKGLVMSASTRGASFPSTAFLIREGRGMLFLRE